MSCTDSDWPAVYWNLKKTRQRWARVRCVLTRDGATPKISGMFYKALAQSVLLYGVETWTLSQSIVTALEGFHHRVARALSGLKPKLQNGEWVYPPIANALSAASMHPLSTYIERRRRYLRAYVALSPVLSHCLNPPPRLSGTPTGKVYWWEQDLTGLVV